MTEFKKKKKKAMGIDTFCGGLSNYSALRVSVENKNIS